MKVREVININRTLTLQELYEFMQQCWDKTTYNDFVLGRPAVGAFRDYILLPATKRYVISIYPHKDKVIITVMPNLEGQIDLAGSVVLGGYGQMGLTAELRGLASQVNELYAAYIESLFAEAGLLSGFPQKQKCPIIKHRDGEKMVENVLDLVKIAPPESRRTSNLSFILGIISLVLFFTGIPGLVTGVAAIMTANSVLKGKGYQDKAYRGRFCGKVAVCMSSVMTFILIIGSILTKFYT